MRIVVGRGNKRHVFERQTTKVGREQDAEDLKNFLFRPRLLDKA